MKRLLNDKESAEAGFAVATINEVSARLIAGDLVSLISNAEQIAKAYEILNDFSDEEQLELLMRALKGGGKIG